MLYELPRKSKNAISDIRAAPNLIRKSLILHIFSNIYISMKPSLVRSAANTELAFAECIELAIQLVHHITRTDLPLDANLPVDMLLRTVFINENTKRIFPRREVVVPSKWSPVSLKTQTDATLPTNLEEDQSASVYEKQEPHLCSVVKPKMILRLSGALVIVKSKANELQSASTHCRLIHSRLTLVAQGVVDVVLNYLFVIKIAN